MYLVVIAWTYVVLMMSVAEATNTNGTILGALMTFVLYGALPIAIVVYLMGAPARNKAIKKRNLEEVAKARLDAHQINSTQAADPAHQGSARALPSAASGRPDSSPPSKDSGAPSTSGAPDAGGHTAGGPDTARPNS